MTMSRTSHRNRAERRALLRHVRAGFRAADTVRASLIGADQCCGPDPREPLRGSVEGAMAVFL